MIAALFALEFEAKDFKKTIISSDIICCIAGKAGPKVTDGFKDSIRKNNIQCIVSMGLAGGLNQSLCTGEVIVAKNYTSPQFFSSLDTPDKSFGFANLATVDKILESRSDKRFCRDQTGADCCDMETAHVWSLARELSVPIISIRAISDTANADLPIPGHVLIDPKTDQPSARLLMQYLLRHPACVPSFARMVRQASFATRQLARITANDVIPRIRKTMAQIHR